MNQKEPLFMVIIPMKKSAEFVKEMDFYNLFQQYFVRIYGLKLDVKEIDDNNCEVIFKGSEPAIQAVVQVLSEMGMTPVFTPSDSKFIDDPKKYH